jgi:hypothetical protein
MEHIVPNLILLRQKILPPALLLNTADEIKILSLRIWDFPGSNLSSEIDALLNEIRRFDGLRCHNIHTRVKFRKYLFRHSKVDARGDT